MMLFGDTNNTRVPPECCMTKVVTTQLIIDIIIDCVPMRICSTLTIYQL